jgi:hypothetical protein
MQQGRAETSGVSARNQQSNFGGGKRVRSSQRRDKTKVTKMLPIDHHVQTALYKFNREMKRLNQGPTLPSLAGQPSKDGPDVDRREMVKWLYRVIVNGRCHRNFRKEREMLKRITHKRPSKHTALNGFLTRRGLFAKATLSSSLSTEEKLSWLSIGIWIPYHHL